MLIGLFWSGRDLNLRSHCSSNPLSTRLLDDIPIRSKRHSKERQKSLRAYVSYFLGLVIDQDTTGQERWHFAQYNIFRQTSPLLENQRCYENAFDRSFSASSVIISDISFQVNDLTLVLAGHFP